MMNKLITLFALMAATSPVFAEDLTGSDRLLCTINTVQLCLETGGCHQVSPVELDIPGFIVVDARKGTLSTTKVSGLNRSTTAGNFQRENGRIVMQGIQNNRAFTISIEEDLGFMTGAVARDGIAVAVFGACTDADV